MIAPRLSAWMAGKGWTPLPFQEAAWALYADGASGLIHAPTGTGKTLAAFLGPLSHWIDDPDPAPLQLIWITPLRALAVDTQRSLLDVLEENRLPGSIGLRTGDTPAAERQRQRRRPPTVLVTTPESLTLLLSYTDAASTFSRVQAVVVDEWHELMGSKRGVQTELALARLRAFSPGLRTWGLSATLGNLEEAHDVLLGCNAAAPRNLVQGAPAKSVRIDTVLPAAMDRFPWAGHLGLHLLPEVLREIDAASSTLLFTNTRAQTERWHQAILEVRPEWTDAIAMHHGSLEHDLRLAVEARLRAGELKCVVCTSSLDLGVDFSPVELVIQVGSPKGVGRLLQRAGRSGHRPGAASRMLCVPAHAFELIEFAAVRRELAQRRVEARSPLCKPLDVLAQHLVTVALGGGFEPDALLAEVRTTFAYRDLTDEEWTWALDFVTRGGKALSAYPDFKRVVLRDGRCGVESKRIAGMHRMSIGTIAADGAVRVKFLKGGAIGRVEEQFVSRLRPGDRFLFAGRVLALVRVRDMTAYVRKAKGGDGTVPVWMGGRMPLSSQLARAVREELADNTRAISPERRHVQPILDVQQRWSVLPAPHELLLERTGSREGEHLFLYPFAGRHLHEGLAALLAYRVARRRPASIQAFATDYGIELLSRTGDCFEAVDWPHLFSADAFMDDLYACLNAAELTRRHFREVARVAGLVFQGYPGRGKSLRNVQASSSLFFEVYQRYDPDNLLLEQARREALDRQLEAGRLGDLLKALGERTLVERRTERLTPFAFPIWAERTHSHVTTQNWEERVREAAARLERAAGRTQRKEQPAHA